MTELRDPAQLIIIATGSCLPPLLLWPRTSIQGSSRAAEAQAGASEWAGKDEESP